MLAKDKGVHREVESKGSRRQNPGLTNRNCIQGQSESDKVAIQPKVRYCPGVRMVDAAGIWDESYRFYPGRSHGRADVFFSEVRSKACREKSAEAITPITIDRLRQAGYVF
ncbi:MAG: hypothetical protein ACNS62_02160 [Candidatus Cyclobacteriaceae bacterium M3_2C_046]